MEKITKEIETVTITLEHYNMLRDANTVFNSKELFLNQKFNGYYFLSEVVNKDNTLKDLLKNYKDLLDENQKLKIENYKLINGKKDSFSFFT